MGCLRLFLAVSVVLWHIPDNKLALVDARAAVLLFFIISGFYMALVLNEKYSDTKAFYGARLIRIYPVYLAMVFVMLAWFTYRPSPHVFGQIDLPTGQQIALSLLNLILVGQDLFQAVATSKAYGEQNLLTAWVDETTGGRALVGNHMLVGHAWSLSSELLFYGLAPFVVRSVPRILLLGCGSVAIRAAILSQPGFTSPVWGYFFLPSTLCLFLLGSLAYHLYARTANLEWAKLAGKIGLAGIVVYSAYFLYADGEVMASTKAQGYDTPASWAAFLGFALALPFVFGLTKHNGVDRWIGELSYPVYIVHGLVIGMVLNIWSFPKTISSELLIVGTSLAGGGAMILLVDKPVEWVRRKSVQATNLQPGVLRSRV